MRREKTIQLLHSRFSIGSCVGLSPFTHNKQAKTSDRANGVYFDTPKFCFQALFLMSDSYVVGRRRSDRGKVMGSFFWSDGRKFSLCFRTALYYNVQMTRHLLYLQNTNFLNIKSLYFLSTVEIFIKFVSNF